MYNEIKKKLIITAGKDFHHKKTQTVITNDLHHVQRQDLGTFSWPEEVAYIALVYCWFSGPHSATFDIGLVWKLQQKFLLKKWDACLSYNNMYIQNPQILCRNYILCIWHTFLKNQYTNEKNIKYNVIKLNH